MPSTTPSPRSRGVRVAALTAVGAITVPLALLQAFPAHAAPSVGMPDSYTVAAGSTLTVGAPGVFANDSDADGVPLSISGNTSPGHGALDLDQATGAFTYTPLAGFSGADTFDYYLIDPDEADNVAGPFTVTITVTGGVATLAPVAVDDAYTVDNDGPTAFDPPALLANDSDGDSAFTVSNWTNPSHGTVAVFPGGSFTYTPTAGYVGTDSFTYRLTDGQNLSGYATVTLTVQDPVEPASPVAVDDAYTVPAGAVFSLENPHVFDNDSDADSTFFLMNHTEPAHGTLTMGPGWMFFEPDAGFVGTDSFTYQLMDPQGHLSNWATVTLTVEDPAATQPPVAVDDAYTATAGTTLTIPWPAFLGNDTDPDSLELDIVDETDPSHGTVSFVPDGPVLYTPDAGFTGTDTMTYRAQDADGNLSNVATVTFTVEAPTTQTPVAVDDSYTTIAGTPLTIAAPAFFANDTDADSTVFTYASITEPSFGWIQTQPDGSIIYNPGGFVGTETLQYSIADPEGNVSNLATVTFTVLPAGTETTPVAVDDAYTVERDTPITVAAPGVFANDSDADGDPFGFMTVLTPGGGLLMGEDISFTPAGGFTYTPPTGYTGQRTFAYSIVGDDGASISADIVFTIVAVNTAPVAVMNSYVVAPGETLTVPPMGVLANDSDADGDILSVVTYGTAPWGSFTGQPDGSFVYVAPAGFEGSLTIPYTVWDGTETATADIVIVVETPRDEEPGGPGTPGDPEGPGGSTEPGLPTQPTRPEGEGDGGSLASTGADLTGAVAVTGVAGLLLALGALLRRLSRRAA